MGTYLGKTDKVLERVHIEILLDMHGKPRENYSHCCDCSDTTNAWYWYKALKCPASSSLEGGMHGKLYDKMMKRNIKNRVRKNKIE